MPFSIKTIAEKQSKAAFFSVSRREIETLLLTDLDPLEEYGLLVCGQNSFLIAHSEIEIPDACHPVQVVLSAGCMCRESRLEAILNEMEKLRPPRKLEIGFSRMSADLLRGLEKKGFACEDISGEIDAAARVKTCGQADIIRKNAEMNEYAFLKLAEKLIPGVSEIEALGVVEQAYADLSGSPPEKVYDLIAGVRTGQVSGRPSNYRLKDGDALIADLLPLRNGLYCDTTRTLFVGKKSAHMLEAGEIISQALREGERVLASGVSGAEVYAAVADVFTKHKVSERFPHHAGHGVGFGIFERPYFLPRQADKLAAGMVVTLEPGLYFEGEFGLRKENNYLITENGFIRFGSLA